MRTVIFGLIVLFSLAAKPVTSPASRPTTIPAKSYESLNAALQSLPAEHRPSRKQGWTPYRLRLANKWYKENASGSTIKVGGAFIGASEESKGKINVSISPDKIFIPWIGFRNANFVALSISVPSKDAGQISRFREGSKVSVTGKVDILELIPGGPTDVAQVRVKIIGDSITTSR